MNQKERDAQALASRCISKILSDGVGNGVEIETKGFRATGALEKASQTDTSIVIILKDIVVIPKKEGAEKKKDSQKFVILKSSEFSENGKIIIAKYGNFSAKLTLKE